MRIQTWLARHAQTLLGSLGRITQQPLATLMTTAVIAIALALPLLLGVLLQNARAATADWNQAFDISVYLKMSAPHARAEALARQWRARPDVAAVKIIPAAAALAQFRESSGFGAALDALTENPLPDTLVVTPSVDASTPQGTEALRAVLAAAAEVETAQVDSAWVQRLDAMLAILRRIIQVIGAFLSLGVVLVVGNTIRLDILNRRAEIEVMKLVGATDGFARRPFLYGGVWYGLTGGLLAVVLVEAAIWLMDKPVARLAGSYGNAFRLNGVRVGTGLAVVLVAAGLGWLGSWLAATRHIRAIEPT